jgi:4-amino-4-deoxy-L-arabinose transferase-like glycosyltransferase
VAAVTAVVHLAVATRYGWHRDEFYYVITGRHPAWGYVDQPPITPLLARLAAELPGGVLPLRVFAILAQIGCVLLAARLAAELGGRGRAQGIAAAAVAASPAFVGAAMLFGTTGTDQLVWAFVLVAVARAVRLRTTGAWLLAGVAAGIGMENKDTTAVLLVGVAIGFLVWRRDVLRTSGPWLAGALAVALAVPNLVWNALHGWPQIQMAGVLSARDGGPLAALAQLPVLLLLLAGPPLVLLWVLGVRWLWGVGREHRWLLMVAVVALVLFTAGGGKLYYPAPALLALFAAGAVRVEAAGRHPIAWRGAIAVSWVLALLIGLPVLPVAADNALRVVNPNLVETFGWPDFVRQVTKVADTLPPGTVIFTSNYGEAGALTMLGPDAGLRDPVASGQNAYAYWAPPTGSADTVLCVGEFGPSYLRRYWSDVREIAPITMPDGVQNEEVVNHAAMYLCQRPRGTWAQLWPSLAHIS